MVGWMVGCIFGVNSYGGKKRHGQFQFQFNTIINVCSRQQQCTSTFLYSLLRARVMKKYLYHLVDML